MQIDIQNHLEYVSERIPTNFYWADANGIILGLNKKVLYSIGATNKTDVIGKTVFDIYPVEIANDIWQHAMDVIKSAKDISREHKVQDISTGEIRYFSDSLSPIIDKTGQVIGVIGTSIETTFEKVARSLELENSAHKIEAEQQAKFRKTVEQVAHDIRSPLASLDMIAKLCTDIPEEERVTLREVASRINDITNNLLYEYKKDDPVSTDPEKILVSLALKQIISEKRFQYKDMAVNFIEKFNQNSYFTFIEIDQVAFKRMISNVINNGVDALNGKVVGDIHLGLRYDQDLITIIIEDNGKGMPEDVADKIRNKVAITHGKTDGHGIGLAQVRETLENAGGWFSIHSTRDVGTRIELGFKVAKTPDWVATSINIRPDDIILVLDDDASIHRAWDIRFDQIAKDIGINLDIRHYMVGSEVLSFVESLPIETRKKVFLLSDFELLKQDLNGLDVITILYDIRSILVTSHYGNHKLQEMATSFDTKILPKQLASEIPIYLDKDTISVPRFASSIKNALEYLKKRSLPIINVAAMTSPPMIKTDNNSSQVEFVIVDDDLSLLKGLTKFVFKDKIVDTYQNPHEFLKNIGKYSKDTKICLDNDFGLVDINGQQLAKDLHDLGYTRLYLLSGTDFEQKSLPKYLTALLKSDTDNLKKVLC